MASAPRRRRSFAAPLIVGSALSAAILAGCGRSAAPPPDLVADVRQAIADNDFARGDRLILSSRTADGVTPVMLEALSWMGRGAAAKTAWDDAERYARETYDLCRTELAKRPLDQEPHLPTALGASIEVLGQVAAARGDRSGAVQFLEQQRVAYEHSSIEKRIRKNENLLSMEGETAPALDLSEYIGSKPPPLTSFTGKPLVLFFWAHWCPDCKLQGPILAKLLAKYAATGLTIVAPTQRYGYVANGDAAPPEVEMPYIEQVMHTYYPMLVGQAVPVSTANHVRYGVTSTPTLVLVDRRGIVRLYHPGRMTEAELEPLVQQLVSAR